jgi:hypothetical protein
MTRCNTMGCLSDDKPKCNDSPTTGYKAHLVYGDLYWIIQAQNVSILVGDNISYCETRSSCEHVPNSELLPTWSCLNLVHTVLPSLFPYAHTVPEPCRVRCTKT